MQVKRFFAADMRQAMKLVRDELGAEAAIIGNRRIAGGVELTAALDYKLSALAPRVPNIELEDELRSPIAARWTLSPTVRCSPVLRWTTTSRSSRRWTNRFALRSMRPLRLIVPNALSVNRPPTLL